jgi:hypothetical protein
MEIKKEIQRVEEILLRKHPNWSQDKARWIAEQALGIRGWR